MFKNVAKCLIVISFGLNLATASEPSSFLIPREDGSFLEGYIVLPENNTAPILFAIQGSGCESTYRWFLELENYVKPLGLGLIMLEKQGVSKDAINNYEYNQTNSLDHRIQDHEHCIRNLNMYVYPDWSGEVVLLGESEGGMIASELASNIPQVKALMLFATGGGMKVEDEIQWMIKTKLAKYGASHEEIDGYIATFDEKIAEMINNPTPDKLYLGNTYKWWASLLTFKDPILNLKKMQPPFYMIHGTQDEIIPIQSTDLLAHELTKKGKREITYQKLNGFGHNLNQPVIIKNAFLWLESVIANVDINFFSEKISFTNELAHNDDWINFPNYKESNWEIEIMEYCVARGRTEVEGRVSGKRDSEGNQKSTAEVSISTETDNGWHGEARARASASQDKDGNNKGEVEFEANLGKKFR